MSAKNTADGGVNTFSILGFQIERKTSFTALAAFVLALWGAIVAISNFWIGPKPQLLQPDRIVAFKDQCDHTEFPIVNFLMRLSIHNTAPKDYGAVLRDFRILFKVGDKTYHFTSEKYAIFGESTKDLMGKVGCVNQDKDLIFFVKPGRLVNTEIVDGGGLYSKELLFAPDIPPCPNGEGACYARNYLKYEDFVKEIGRLAVKNQIMSFSIQVLYGNETDQSKSCSVHTNDQLVRALTKFKHFDVFCNERQTFQKTT